MASTLLDSLYSLAQRAGAVDKILAESIKAINTAVNSKWTAVDASTSQKGIVQLSASTSSTSTTVAATSSAVKEVADMVNNKWSAVDATTSAKGIVQLSDAINSTSTTLAATANAVKKAYDLANGKWTAVDATTSAKGIVQLSTSTSSTSTALAATASAVKTAYDLANAAMPKTGGKFTGAVFENAVSLSGSTITVSNGAVFTKTVTADTTFTITGSTSGAAAIFTLILTNGGNYTVAWPSAVKWAGATAPTLTSSGVDVLTFVTPNGTTWYGVVSSLSAA